MRNTQRPAQDGSHRSDEHAPSEPIGEARLCELLVARLAEAVILFDAAGAIVYENEAGRRAAAASGLLLEGGRLKGKSASVSNQVNEAFRTAVGGSASIICLGVAKHRVHWLFQPYCPISGTSETGRGVAALARLPLRTRALGCFAEAYGLTAAEARVLACLIEHDASIEAIAQKAGVSVSTIRSHIKSLFQKTRTRQQRQLVTLALSLPEPLLDR